MAYATDTLFGVYAGPPSVAEENLNKFTATTGFAREIVTEFLAGAEVGDHDSMLRSLDYALEKHETLSPGLDMDLAIPLLPAGDAANGMTLQDVANGALDSTFEQVGVRLGAHPDRQFMARLGWEPQNKNYKWGWQKPEVYVAAFRQAAQKIFLVPGTDHVKFTWCCMAGRYSLYPDPMALFPGKRFIDFFSLDAYDKHWLYSHDGKTDYSAENQTAVWHDLVAGTGGLNYYAHMAEVYGKPLAISEWGVTIRDSDGQGGMDNPMFVNRMFDWMLGNDLEWMTYFNVDGLGVQHTLTDNTKFPLSRDALRSRFAALEL